NLNSGVTYTFQAQAADVAGNVQSALFSGSFLYDNTPPTASINNLASASISTLTSLSGTAADTAPGALSSVSLAFRQVTGSGVGGAQWWNPGSGLFSLAGSTPPATALVPATFAAGSWSIAGSSMPAFSAGNDYQVFVVAADSATNKNAFPGLGTPE